MTGRPTLRSRLSSALVVAGVCLAAPLARADAPAPLLTSLTGEAKGAFEGGNLLYDNHDFAGAATKYRAAYAASHDARLLWNMAACEKELRHYARAASLVEQFMREAAQLVSPDFIAQANVTLGALRQFYSPVALTVTPAGTHVLVDGDDVGTAPFERPVPVDLGKHVVRSEREGFEPVETRIDVVGQSPMALEVALKPVQDAATLTIAPADEHASVSVDDKVVAEGRWQGALAPGKHQLKVTADGKQPRLVEIELGRGEHRSIDVTLEDDKKKGALWPWLVGGGAVVVAGGAIGAYFLFKPSDTEGPAPAGKLGTVYVSSPRFGRR